MAVVEVLVALEINCYNHTISKNILVNIDNTESTRMANETYEYPNLK